MLPSVTPNCRLQTFSSCFPSFWVGHDNSIWLATRLMSTPCHSSIHLLEKSCIRWKIGLYRRLLWSTWVIDMRLFDMGCQDNIPECECASQKSQTSFGCEQCLFPSYLFIAEIVRPNDLPGSFSQNYLVCLPAFCFSLPALKVFERVLPQAASMFWCDMPLTKRLDSL